MAQHPYLSGLAADARFGTKLSEDKICSGVTGQFKF